MKRKYPFVVVVERVDGSRIVTSEHRSLRAAVREMVAMQKALDERGVQAVASVMAIGDNCHWRYVGDEAISEYCDPCTGRFRS